MKSTAKYLWAALLSLSVAGLALTERDSALRPLLNGVIDLIQQQYRNDAPKDTIKKTLLRLTGQVPASPGPLNFPARQKIEPAAPNGPAIAPADVTPGHQ